MPHIIVKLWKGKSEAQKKKLADELVKTAMSVIGYEAGSFSVAIEEVEPNEWKGKVYEPDIIQKSETLYKNPGYKMD
ncbi:MAG: tautomerase family protein [Flavisolibacter sp.]|nr:tautomerase family protein [Flavisolibacter sp.]